MASKHLDLKKIKSEYAQEIERLNKLVFLLVAASKVSFSYKTIKEQDFTLTNEGFLAIEVALVY